MGPSSDQASSDESDAESSASLSWLWILIALALIACLLFALLAARRKKNRKEEPELGICSEQLNPMFAQPIAGELSGSAALLAPFISGDEPIYALAFAKNELYDAFRRAIAFDHMYYGNPPLVLDDAALDDVYSVLQHAKCPSAPDLPPLREVCRRFLDLEIETKEPSENAIEDIAMFLDSAIADDLVERAIDALAKHSATHGGLLGDPIYDMGGTVPEPSSLDEVLANLFSAFDEDYRASDNPFLVPVDSNSLLRQLPRGGAGAEAIYDMSSGRDPAEAIYDMSSGRDHSEGAAALAPAATGVVAYSMADFNRGTHVAEYAESSPLGADTENTYELATGPAVADTYDMATNVSGSGGEMNVYDAAGPMMYRDVAPDAEHADNDNIYSMATGPAGANPGLGRSGDAIYDMGGVSGTAMGGGAKDRASVIYDFGGPRTDSSETDVDGLTGDGPVYDIGFNIGSSTDDVDDQLYDNVAIGTMKAAGGQCQPRSINLMADVPVYDTAGSATDPVSPRTSMESKPLQLRAPVPDVLTPAVYTTGDDGGPVAAPLYAMGSGPVTVGPAEYDVAAPASMEPETEIEGAADDAYLGIGNDAGDIRRNSASPTLVPVLYDTAGPLGDSTGLDYNPRPGSIFVDASNSIRLKSVVRKNPLVGRQDCEDESQTIGMGGRTGSYANALDTFL